MSRNSRRAKRARKYFQGGKMPDGLELFPLDGGKLEIMQEIIEAGESDEMDEASLGAAMLFMYASRYKSLKGMDLDDIIEAGMELGRNTTLEDRQAAEEVILADFDALGASMTEGGKQEARMEAARSHSATHVTSGQEWKSDTAETNSNESARSKSSRSTSPTSTLTREKETPGSGATATENNSTGQDKNYEALAAPNG